MTDFAATSFGRTILLQAAIMQLEAKRQSMGKQNGDDVELRQRQEALDDALSVRQIEIETEIKRTSELLGQVATLEGKIRDLEDELRVVSAEKAEQAKLIVELEEKRIAYGGELFKKQGEIARLHADIRCLKALVPKADK